MTNSKEQNFAQHIPLFASLFSLFLGLIAAYFSWRAYSISSETRETVLYQMRPNIIISNSIRNGFDLKPDGKFFCGSNASLQNVGGKPTSLVGYDVHILYQDKTVEFPNEALMGFALTDSTISPALSQFRAVMYTHHNEVLTFEKVSNSDFSGVVQFPMQIEAYSAIDLETALYYIIDFNKGKHDPSNWYYNAVIFSFALHFSSGQILETPKTTCSYILSQ